MKQMIIGKSVSWSIIFFIIFVFFNIGGAGQKTLIKNENLKTAPDKAADFDLGNEKESENLKENIIKNERVESGDYRIVTTPFGNVKQRISPSRKMEMKKEAAIALDPQKLEMDDTQETETNVVADISFSADKKPEKPVEDEKLSDKSQVVLNFDDADIYEVVKTLAELLGINYIIDSNVRGAVTIHTAGHLQKKDLFPVFFQILEINAMTAVMEDNLYKIIKLKDVSRMPILSNLGRTSTELLRGERIIIQIIPLKFISASEMTKLVTPFVSTEGTIVAHKDSNMILVVDKSSNILKVLRLIEVFDVNIFEKFKHQFYFLENVNAEETAKTLNEIFDTYGTAVKEEAKFIAIERLNSIFAISSKPQVFEKVQNLIQQLDLPSHDIDPRIYVYSVRNGEAVELAELLNNVFSKGSTQKDKKTSNKTQEEKKADSAAPKALFPSTQPKDKNRKTGTKGTFGTLGSGTLKGEVKITPDERRNTLIIEAVPADYRIIENILNRLDIMPKQVLIEVTIAEITLGTKTDLGVEWEYFKGEGDLSISGLNPEDITGSAGLIYSNANIGSAGLRYLIGKTDRWKATLHALASQNKVNILSTPSILASDNKEARIDVTTEVPVANTTYRYTDTTDTVIPTSIEYRDTGVILTVTPHINEHNLVSMDINQEVSEQADFVQVGGEGETAPSFFKRSVNTTLTVKHAQTIVIGGLIRKNESMGTSSIPCLGDIPVMSYLFGTKTKSEDKTELIILITPRVIASLEDVDVVTEEFKSKVGNAIKNFNK